MSRSIHQTNASVFNGKSKSEVDEMTNAENLDPDVVKLREKSGLKKTTRDKRKETAFSNDTQKK